MHYYQFNIADYRKDTAHLSIVEHYIYRQLIDWYFLDEKPISKLTQSVMRRLSLGSENVDCLKNVLEDFFTKEGDGWHHARIDADISQYQSNAEKNRENGKKGGRPKKQELSGNQKPKKTQPVNLDNPTETQSKGNQEPRTNNQEPITKVKTKSVFVLPDWINQELWDGFMEVITKLKASNSEAALKSLITKLSKLKESGFDPNEAISTSLENSWKGVFEPRSKQARGENHQFNKENYAETEIPSWMT